jgi:hypothetical protein
MCTMIFLPRYESNKLKIYRSLSSRMILSKDEIGYYQHLEKGYSGEKMFDVWLGSLNSNCLILNDLLFEVNNNTVQIDSLLIARDKIYQFEVKNYDGDYYVEGEKWYKLPQKEINNPILQMQRSDTLLRRLLKDMRCHLPIESYLILINPHFTLYQAPINPSIIFPTQIENFIKKLDTSLTHSVLNGTHSNLAQKLMGARKNDFPNSKVPSYSYEQLKKGIICCNCRSFIDEFNGKSVLCMCGHIEDVGLAVLRSADEFTLLFPEKKITTNAIQEWCDIIKTRRAIGNILSKKYSLIAQGKSSHYILS